MRDHGATFVSCYWQIRFFSFELLSIKQESNFLEKFVSYEKDLFYHPNEAVEWRVPVGVNIKKWFLLCSIQYTLIYILLMISLF